MKTDQQLISESRDLINQINKENNAQQCTFLIDEFLERYEIWPNLQKVCFSLDPLRIADKQKLFEFEKMAFEEIHTAYLTILSYSEQQDIAIPKHYIDLYEQVCLSSAGFTGSRFEAVRDMLILLESQGHRTFAGQFTVLAKTEGFYECTFSPSYIKWQEKKDELKKSPWYSFDQLNRFKKNKSYDADYPLLSENDHLLRELQNIMLLAGREIDSADYKSHVTCLHEYTKQVLLNPVENQCKLFDIYYEGDTGKMLINKQECKLFDPNDIEGKLLFTLSPGGKPCKDPMPLDEIGIEVFDMEKITKKEKDSLYKAYLRINAKIKAKFGISSLITSDNKGNMLWNSEYTYKID